MISKFEEGVIMFQGHGMNCIEPSHYSDNRVATEGRRIIRSISGLYQNSKWFVRTQH